MRIYDENEFWEIGGVEFPKRDRSKVLIFSTPMGKCAFTNEIFKHLRFEFMEASKAVDNLLKFMGIEVKEDLQ